MQEFIRRPGAARRQFWIERLEDRHMLSANSLQSDAASVFDMGVMIGNDKCSHVASGDQHDHRRRPGRYEICPPIPVTENTSLASGALLALAPFPLEETFFLHSLPGSTYTIYLDFTGHLTRDTPWNMPQGPFPANIVTPPYDLDARPDNLLGV